MNLKLTDSSDAIFHTIQGEGKFVGYPSTFVRLSQCNLRCQWKNPDGSFTRCDTPHTSFDPVKVDHDVKDILTKIKYDHVVVTGGEPFFQKGVVDLIKGLRDNGHYVTVETNGTIFRENQAQFISISPKLSSSSMCPDNGKRHEKNRININNLSKFVLFHKYQFKFVVNDKDDILEIEDIADQIMKHCGEDIHPHIWLMPQGTSQAQFDEKMGWIAEVCKEKQWKLTDRLHVRIWGAKKGV